MAIIALVFFLTHRPLNEKAIEESLAIANVFDDGFYEPGPFDSRSKLKVESVKIKEKQLSTSAYSNIRFTSTPTETYRVVVDVKLSNDQMNCFVTLDGRWEKVNGKWLVNIPSLTFSDKKYSATQAPDKKLIKEGIEEDFGGYSFADYEISLPKGKLKVKDNKISMSVSVKQETLISEAEGKGEVQLSFSKENGRWSIEDTDFDQDDLTYSYEPLVGTWEGTFLSTEASLGADCYAASDQPCTITIDSVDPNTHMVSGTFTAVQHNHHVVLENDVQSTPGDVVVENVPFQAVFEDDDYLSGLDLSSGLSYKTVVSSGGTMVLEIGFEPGEDGESGALYAYVKSLGASWTDPAYGDTYSLEKTE